MNKSLDDFTGVYGQSWTQGILIDRLGDCERQTGACLFTSPHGFLFICASVKGGSAIPVLCGEIVEIWTEDGKTDGRCGSPVKTGNYACPGHHAQIEEWRNSSEMKRIWLERDSYYQ